MSEIKERLQQLSSADLWALRARLMERVAISAKADARILAINEEMDRRIVDTFKQEPINIPPVPVPHESVTQPHG